MSNSGGDMHFHGLRHERKNIPLSIKCLLALFFQLRGILVVVVVRMYCWQHAMPLFLQDLSLLAVGGFIGCGFSMSLGFSISISL